MGIEKQNLDGNGQPTLFSKCSHGVFADARGNSACESCLEHRLTSNYLLGISSGVKLVAEKLLERSGAEFTAGHDEIAKTFRLLSTEFTKLSEKCRRDMDVHDMEKP